MCLPIVVEDPSRLLAQGEHCGLEWNVTHNTIGHRCGYVRLPKGHPWHGKPYNELDVDVHGGLTFDGYDTPCDKGGADDAYWIGFDCAHCFDAPDPALPGSDRMFGMSAERRDEIRTQEYVEGECRRLCEQVGGQSFITFLEYLEFPPGTKANASFRCHAVEWQGQGFFVVSIPTRFAHLAEKWLKHFGLKAKDGIPTMIVPTTTPGAKIKHLGGEPIGVLRLPGFDSKTCFAVEYATPGHFHYLNKPDLNKTAREIERDELKAFTDAYVWPKPEV